MNKVEVRRRIRKLGLGRIAYQLWHRPVGMLRSSSAKERARIEMIEAQRESMRRAAMDLPRCRGWGSDADPLDIHFLTGAKHWPEAVVCFWSLCQHSELALRLVAVDDGTLDQAGVDCLRRVFPHVAIEDAVSIQERLDSALPEHRFPTLRSSRIHQPLLRKITDLHAGREGWRLLLDSDMVFFRRPDFLLDWLRDGARKPLYMQDVQNAYGFSHELRQGLVPGKRIHDKINIGIFGLRSDWVDFEQLESWLATLLDYEPSPYNLTQGLTSLLLAAVDCAVAPPDDYVCLPTGAELEAPRAAMHHYVAESKQWYFTRGWRRALAQTRS